MATQLRRRADRTGHDDFSQPVTGERRRENGTRHRQTQDSSSERLGRALGWFSIGLGVTEILAPRRVAELIGVKNNPPLFRVVGLREIVSGVGILTRPKPAGWLWSRVAGDVMDLALLGMELDSDNPDRDRTTAAALAVLGVTALDLFTSRRLSEEGNGSRGTRSNNRGVNVREAITVNRPVQEVYKFWRDFKNLPQFMTHLASVEVTGPKRSHWKTAGPAGFKAEWDAEIIDERPNELIAWRSLPTSEVDTAGSVRFRPAPADRGTEVITEMRYQPRGGVLGAAIGKLFGEGLELLVERDLQAFKQVMEVGEVVHSDASIHRGPHPARPSENSETQGRVRGGQSAYARSTEGIGA